jgi:ABC-2 type transport system permease protein
MGLAFRLQRASLIGWGAGVVVIGVAYGWIGPTIDTFIGQNKALAEMMSAGGGGSLTDSYFAASFRLMALIATGFAIQSAMRVRSEETATRADLILATPVSRWRFAASHLAVAFAGSVILLAVAGLATGLSATASQAAAWAAFRVSSLPPSSTRRPCGSWSGSP